LLSSFLTSRLGKEFPCPYIAFGADNIIANLDAKQENWAKHYGPLLPLRKFAFSCSLPDTRKFLQL
jgi:hypothetical protein